MSDVLHRLVSRALAPPDAGRALRPRPDWGLLPAAAPEPNTGGLEESADGEVLATPNRVHLSGAASPPASVAKTPTASSREETVHPESRDGQMQLQAPSVDEHGFAAMPPRSPARPVRRDDRRPSGRVDAALPPVVTGRLSPPGVAAVTEAPAVDRRVVAAGPEPRVAAEVDATRRDPSQPRRQDTATLSRPAPSSVNIVPRSAVEVSTREDVSPWARQRTTRAAAERSERNDPPAVHVTIGRLEIRAPQPAAQPARRQAPPAQTLDEYLSKRATEAAR